MRVAIVDDDAVMAQACAGALTRGGMQCEHFASGEEIVAALRRTTFDVVLLDWKMPGMSGIDVLQWSARSLQSQPPFIMLTSMGDPDSVVEGLEAGAVDYIVKPEDDAIIVARVNAAARRGSFANQRPTRDYGRYTVDDMQREVFLDGAARGLTAKEFDLARMFFENLDRPMARDYLLRTIWGSSEQVETRTLDVHVSKLRSKLTLKPRNGYAIQTVFGFGYRLARHEGGGDEPVGQ